MRNKTTSKCLFDGNIFALQIDYTWARTNCSCFSNFKIHTQTILYSINRTFIIYISRLRCRILKRKKKESSRNEWHARIKCSVFLNRETKALNGWRRKKAFFVHLFNFFSPLFLWKTWNSRNFPSGIVLYLDAGVNHGTVSTRLFHFISLFIHWHRFCAQAFINFIFRALKLLPFMRHKYTDCECLAVSKLANWPNSIIIFGSTCLARASDEYRSLQMNWLNYSCCSKMARIIKIIWPQKTALMKFCYRGVWVFSHFFSRTNV